MQNWLLLLVGFYAFLIGAWSGELIYGNLTADTNRLTAWFTGGQVVVGIAQAALFLWQFHFMKRSVDAANDAAEAARVSAQTARDSFAKLERPYLFVYGVTTIMQDSKRVGGLEPFIKFNIANHGKTPAILDYAAVDLSVDSVAPHAPLEVEQEHVLLTHPIFGAGEVRKGIEKNFPLGIEVKHVGSDQMLLPDIKQDQELFLVIHVRYRGAFTEGHETTGCWRYDRVSGHFTQLGVRQWNSLK